MVVNQLALFDYSQLDTETRTIVQQETDEIKTLVKRSAQDIIAIGQKLTKVKRLLGHGNFGKWLDCEFGWSQQTAKRFVDVATTFQNQQIVDFEMSPSALYALAAPSTPEPARQEAIERATNGETITHQKAREIIENHQTPPSEKLSQPMQLFLSHESVEYYTPPVYIEAARLVMGEIDLDPASCDEAQETVRAAQFYTEADDGLSHEWHGRVWLNPPYSKTGGRSNQELWAQYLISQHEQGNVSEGLLLVKSALGYKWFEELWDLLPACFIRERLSFIKSNGSDDGESKHGTAIFYIGQNLDRFTEIFSAFGRITTPDGRYINGGK